MLAQLGPPDMKSGGGTRKTARWTYLPAPEDPGTLTTLTSRRDSSVEVERKAVKCGAGAGAARPRGARHGRRARRRRDRAGLARAGRLADGDGDEDREWLVRKIVAAAHLRRRCRRDEPLGASKPAARCSPCRNSRSTRRRARATGRRSRRAAPPEIAQPRVRRFVAALAAELGQAGRHGVFGAQCRSRSSTTGR